VDESEETLSKRIEMEHTVRRGENFLENGDSDLDLIGF
jgi:hypothetical protein